MINSSNTICTPGACSAAASAVRFSTHERTRPRSETFSWSTHTSMSASCGSIRRCSACSINLWVTSASTLDGATVMLFVMPVTPVKRPAQRSFATLMEVLYRSL